MILLLDKYDVILDYAQSVSRNEFNDYVLDGISIWSRFSVTQTVEVEAEDAPADLYPNKYLYRDGAFLNNPNWVPPNQSEEITSIKAQLAALLGEE